MRCHRLVPSLALGLLLVAHAPQGAAQEGQLRAGQWQTTQRVLEGTGPAAEIFRSVIAAASEGGGLDSCMAGTTLAALLEEVDGASADEECRVDVVTQTRDRLEIRYRCDGGSGTSVLERLSAEHVRGRMEMKLDDGGKDPSRLRMESESRWVKAACDPGLED